MTTETTLEYDTVDELDWELRGLIESFYMNNNDIDPGDAINTFLAIAEELEIALDEQVIGAFFQRQTNDYVARAQHINPADTE